MIHVPHRSAILFVLCVLASTILATASSAKAASGEVLVEMSRVMEEERTLRVALPDTYDAGEEYVTVYVTDAESNFDLVRSYLAYSASRWQRLPRMIVVGIENVDRNRDFIPRPDPNFPGTGQSNRFLDYVEMEAIPKIEEQYGKAKARILIGHSFGGVNAIQFALERPGVFDAHIAIGSSTWVADRVLFEIARKELEKERQASTWLYMSVAEADGGATVPASREFAAMLSGHAPDALDWRFEIIPETTHFNAVPPSLHNAFEMLFPGWKQEAQLAQVLAGASHDADASVVDEWFAANRAELGYRFVPQAWDLMMFSYKLANEQNFAPASRILENLRQRFPLNASLAQAAGDLDRMAGNFEGAKDNYLAARSIAIAQGEHTNTVISIERRIETITLAIQNGNRRSAP